MKRVVFRRVFCFSREFIVKRQEKKLILNIICIDDILQVNKVFCQFEVKLLKVMQFVNRMRFESVVVGELRGFGLLDSRNMLILMEMRSVVRYFQCLQLRRDINFFISIIGIILEVLVSIWVGKLTNLRVLYWYQLLSIFDKLVKEYRYMGVLCRGCLQRMQERLVTISVSIWFISIRNCEFVKRLFGEVVVVLQLWVIIFFCSIF